MVVAINSASAREKPATSAICLREKLRDPGRSTRACTDRGCTGALGTLEAKPHMKYGNPNRRGRSFHPQPRNATRPTHGGPTRHRCGLLDYFRTARHEPALPGGGAQQRPGAQVVDGQRFKRVLAVLQEMGADEGRLAVDRHGAASAGAGAAAVVEVHVGHLLVEAHEDGEAGRVLDVPYLAAHVVGGRIRRRVELEYLNSRELLWNEFRRHLPAVDAQKEVIRIGMQRSVFAQEDIHRVLQFEESHPWASVEIASGPQDSFLPALSKGELEAAYVTGLGDHEYENLARIRIVDQPVCVPIAANDPLASRPALDFYADLKGRTILSAGVHTSEANREKLRQAGIGLAPLLWRRYNLPTVRTAGHSQTATLSCTD